MHVMMVLTGKMKTDKNFLYPKRCCERVCQSWAIAPIRWSGDQGEGGFNNVSDETSTTTMSFRRAVVSTVWSHAMYAQLKSERLGGIHLEGRRIVYRVLTKSRARVAKMCMQYATYYFYFFQTKLFFIFFYFFCAA